MDSTDLIKILLNQVKERDDLIKILSDNITKLSDAYIVKDKEKEKRYNNTLRISIISCLIAMTVIISIFVCSYFWSDYPISTINGNGNSTISGNNNTNNQNGGAN